jgi:hypothetical protein
VPCWAAVLVVVVVAVFVVRPQVLSNPFLTKKQIIPIFDTGQFAFTDITLRYGFSVDCNSHVSWLAQK